MKKIRSHRESEFQECSRCKCWRQEQGGKCIYEQGDVGIIIQEQKARLESYLVPVTPVFRTFRTWVVTSVTGSTGGLHEMKTTVKEEYISFTILLGQHRV